MSQLEPDLAEPLRDEQIDPAPDFSPRCTLAASEALDKLRRGEPLQHVRIERLCLRGEFDLPIRMQNVVLVQPCFDGATFRQEVALTSCVLDRPRFQRPSRFDKNFILSASTLIKAHFNGLTILGGFFGSNLTTRGKFLVTQSHFEGKVNFWEARFKGWVDFKGCAFAQEVDFRSLHAEEGFVLTRCQFKGDVLFRGATVAKKFQASSSRFEALLDFSKTKMHDFVYLEEIEQGPGQRFAFSNALADRILIRTEQLTGRLASEEKGDYNLAMHEYALLKRCFQSLHRYEQEDWAFYRFKVNQRRGGNRSWRRPWTKIAQLCEWIFLDHGCGYCTNPYRAVRSAAFIILGFGLIYMAGINDFYLEKKPFEDQPVDSLANRSMLGMLTSVSVFTAGIGGIRDLARGWMNAPLMIESILGTLLWGLFIVAFSRKVIR